MPQYRPLKTAQDISVLNMPNSPWRYLHRQRQRKRKETRCCGEHSAMKAEGREVLRELADPDVAYGQRRGETVRDDEYLLHLSCSGARIS